MASGKTSSTQIYHERQRLQFCLLHSLNNLFQQKDAFSRANLDAISDKLVLDDPNKETWTPLSLLFKPHHNAITGNYDINVLIAALEGKGKSVVWHDRRNGVSSIVLDDGSERTLMGIVLNVPVKRYAGLWRGRHWIALRKIDGVWYNLDSDLSAPQSFKDAEEVREFLNYIVGQGGEVLLVKNDTHKGYRPFVSYAVILEYHFRHTDSGFRFQNLWALPPQEETPASAGMSVL